jgi:hypothetical protein
MSNYKFSEKAHFSMGLAPVADAFEGTSGTQYSDVVSLKNYGKVVFLVVTGVGTTGVSAFTVEACDDFVPTTVSAVPFHYRSYDNSDVPGALTAATSAGFSNTAGSNRIHVIEIDAEALLASGYSAARLKTVQSVDSAVLGGIVIISLDPRSTENTGQTSIA